MVAALGLIGYLTVLIDLMYKIAVIMVCYHAIRYFKRNNYKY